MWFYHLAQTASAALGSAWMFVGSGLACALWILVGCLLGWPDAVHLWPTSILTWTTWIAALAIQNTQLVQEAALQKKLDNLIAAIDKADNRLIGIEKQPPAREMPPD
jgi:low affinity Fe/Cu permease